MWNINENHLECLVYGGAVLGGGGGGSIEAGMNAGRSALSIGTPHIVEWDGFSEEARVVTFSRVGSVGQTVGDVDQLNRQFARALELFKQASTMEVDGFIPSEVGPLAVTYGWHESALTGLPVVDAPCNGRAHPLGIMGSLGLHRKPMFITHTTVVGGERSAKNYVELTIKSNVQRSAQLVRNTAAETRTSMAVVRNLLPIGYVRRHAALGGLRYAYRVGKEFILHRAEGLAAILRALSRLMGGLVLAEGTVVKTDLIERSGFTLGTMVIRLTTGEFLRLPVCNEFMLALLQGEVLATFPDLITVFDKESALPLASTQIRVGSNVAIFVVPRHRLKLSSPMADRKLLEPVERLLNIKFPPEADLQQGLVMRSTS
jgi:DUF917 family protein